MVRPATLPDDEARRHRRVGRPFWTDGRRHHMALFLSGYLGKQGVSREQAAAIIERCAADDSDPGAKLTACHDTYDALEAGEAVAGYQSLTDVCGLSHDDLAPLDAILNGFWERNHPNEPHAAVRDTNAMPLRKRPGRPRRRGPLRTRRRRRADH